MFFIDLFNNKINFYNMQISTFSFVVKVIPEAIIFGWDIRYRLKSISRELNFLINLGFRFNDKGIPNISKDNTK